LIWRTFMENFVANKQLREKLPRWRLYCTHQSAPGIFNSMTHICVVPHPAHFSYKGVKLNKCPSGGFSWLDFGLRSPWNTLLDPEGFADPRSSAPALGREVTSRIHRHVQDRTFEESLGKGWKRPFSQTLRFLFPTVLTHTRRVYA